MTVATLHLALEVDAEGSHPAAWRRAGRPPGELLTAARLRELAVACENSGFPLITIDDGLLPPARPPEFAGRIGAMERAAFLAVCTRTVAIAPSLSTTYAEPFYLAWQVASLDHLTLGRAGWVAAADTDPALADVWGRPLVAPETALTTEARDAIEVVRRLWDSWDDDAVLRDVATGRYLDRDRVHHIDFTGASYTISGPLLCPRPPQGQPVVFAAPEVAPAGAVDVRLVRGGDLAAVGSAAAAHPLVFAEVEVALDTPTASAEDRLAELNRYAAWPDRGRLRHVGSAAALVDLLAELAAVVAGVRLFPLVLDEELPELAGTVLPALSRRRLITRPVPGASLRDRLGLPRPVGRYAAREAAR